MPIILLVALCIAILMTILSIAWVVGRFAMVALPPASNASATTNAVRRFQLWLKGQRWFWVVFIDSFDAGDAVARRMLERVRFDLQPILTRIAQALYPWVTRHAGRVYDVVSDQYQELRWEFGKGPGGGYCICVRAGGHTADLYSAEYFKYISPNQLRVLDMQLQDYVRRVGQDDIPGVYLKLIDKIHEHVCEHDPKSAPDPVLEPNGA